MVKDSSAAGLRRKARDVAEEIARGIAAGSRGFEPVQVSQGDYDAWMAVEAAYGRKEETGGGAAEAIDARLGANADKEKVLRAHARVTKLLKQAEAPGRPAFPVPAVPPPKPSVQEISAYAIERAVQLGFPPNAVFAIAKGRGTPARYPLKRARDRIIVELRDRGATYADIGAVFGGRSKEAVYQIDKAARERRLRDIQEQHDARRRNDG
jgi:hypothetical protein